LTAVVVVVVPQLVEIQDRSEEEDTHHTAYQKVEFVGQQMKEVVFEVMAFPVETFASYHRCLNLTEVFAQEAALQWSKGEKFS
jgi:hypothetical protein